MGLVSCFFLSLIFVWHPDDDESELRVGVVDGSEGKEGKLGQQIDTNHERRIMETSLALGRYLGIKKRKPKKHETFV